MQKEGLDIEQVADKLNAAKIHLHQVFITDANMLTSSGLLSPTSVVNIKPIFDLSSQGQIGLLQKTMGKKKALQDIVKYVCSTIDKAFCPVVLITYGTEADAKVVGEGIKKIADDVKVEYANENEFVSAYLGDNSICVSFFGEQRK